MVAHSPAPTPVPEPERRTKWLNEQTTLTNAQVMELRNVLEQHGDAIEDLRAEATSLRERVRSLETCNDEFDRTLAQHDDRLDALEAGEAPAGTPVAPAPVRTMVAQPIGPQDHQLQEFHDALATVVAGLLMYLRLGVAPAGLERISGIAALQAEHRFAEEQARDAEEDRIAAMWLAKQSERAS